MIEVSKRIVYSHACGFFALLHACELVRDAYERHWVWSVFHVFFAAFSFWGAHEYSKPEDRSWL